MSNATIENVNPLISIIIPVYNPGRHLTKCLESISKQTYKNLEIILIDDGSTDGSSRILDEYANADERVICVHQPNGGVSKARNQGLKIAKGEYIHFPDSDDYLDLDTYEYLINLIKKHNCEVINFEHYVTFPDKEIAHSFTSERYGLFDVAGAQKQFMTGVQFCCNKLYKRELIYGVNEDEKLFFREDIFRGEDTLFAVHAVERANCVWFDKRPLYHYVQSEESACRGKFRKSQLSIVLLYDAYEPLYKNKYPDIWKEFLLFMEENLISIYYDMWADEINYKHEQKRLRTILKEKYKLIKKIKMGKKRRLKFIMFLTSPTLFCLIHKIIH